MLFRSEELVKKEPVTPSPDTTSSSRLVTLDARKASRSSMKKKPVISSPKSSRLIVLDAYTASSSSSRTSSDSEKEIEKLENQFRGLEVKRLHQPTSTTLTKNWYPRTTPLTSSSRKGIVTNSQCLLVNSMSGT